jgi:hypothetical protein
MSPMEALQLAEVEIRRKFVKIEAPGRRRKKMRT